MKWYKLYGWQEILVSVIATITFFVLFLNLRHTYSSIERAVSLIDPIVGAGVNAFMLWILFVTGNLIYRKIRRASANQTTQDSGGKFKHPEKQTTVPAKELSPKEKEIILSKERLVKILFLVGIFIVVVVLIFSLFFKRSPADISYPTDNDESVNKTPSIMSTSSCPMGYADRGFGCQSYEVIQNNLSISGGCVKGNADIGSGCKTFKVIYDETCDKGISNSKWSGEYAQDMDIKCACKDNYLWNVSKTACVTRE